MLEKLYTKRKGRTVQCQIRFFEVLSCEISQTDSSETNIICWRKSEFCRTWATSTLVRRSLCTPHRRLQRSDMRLSRNTGGKNQIIPYSSSTLLSLFTDVWHSFSLTLRTLWGLGQSRASVLWTGLNRCVWAFLQFNMLFSLLLSSILPSPWRYVSNFLI